MRIAPELAKIENSAQIRLGFLIAKLMTDSSLQPFDVVVLLT